MARRSEPHGARRAWQAFALGALLVTAAFRPGVDRLDRWLASVCWRVPSAWNTVADVAIATGVVDSRVAGRTAPWRQAVIVDGRTSRVAIVIVSDLHHSIATLIDDRYKVLGRFERLTGDAAVVTDQARGYKPLTNIWPFGVHEGRLATLIGSRALVSEQPNEGVYAYVAIGPDRNELLFAIHMRWGPGPTWGVLDRLDVNGDGLDDFVVYAEGKKSLPPLAAFVWDASHHTYTATVSKSGSALLTFWTTADDRRIWLSPYEPIDSTVQPLMRLLDGGDSRRRAAVSDD